MDAKENLHAGHRERMIDKFLSNSDSFLDHELLEIFLYTAIPRIDTNPIAHKLLRSFGSLDKLFDAKPEQIMSVKGVGKKTAYQIYLVGKICKKIKFLENKIDNQAYYSFAKYKDKIIKFFENLEVEQFVIILLNKKYKEITKLCFIDHERHKVTASIPEIAQAFALNKPTYAIIAHNHLSGSLEPSSEDDFATGKLNILCNVHGVSLIDHVVVAGKDAISYYLENRLEPIKQKFNVGKLLSGEENL